MVGLGLNSLVWERFVGCFQIKHAFLTTLFVSPVGAAIRRLLQAERARVGPRALPRPLRQGEEESGSEAGSVKIKQFVSVLLNAAIQQQV